MGFLSDLAGGGGNLSGFVADPSGLLGISDDPTFQRLADPLDLFGEAAGRAADEAAVIQEDAANRAITEEQRGRAAGQEFLAPFGGVGERAVELSGFLGDPQAQFEFLQNNPIFKLALENANRQTQQRAAAGGRLSAGDTLTQLSNNVLLSAQPLIQGQRQDIGNLLNLGTGIAQTQANVAIGEGTNVGNLLTDIGNIGAANVVAGQQARQRGAETGAQIAGSIFGFSDSRLKDSAEKTGVNEGGYDIWRWVWNKLAKDKFGLSGSSHGVMFSDVLERNPKAIKYHGGYGQVNYGMIGVKNGN